MTKTTMTMMAAMRTSMRRTRRMNFHERLRRKGPVFESHQKAHEEVLANEGWFGDGVPLKGKQFTVAAKQRAS
jgi:hypothetical protein